MKEFHGGALYGVEDVWIAAAPTKIAIERLDDLVTRWVRVGAKQGYGSQNHPGHAVATLHGVFVDEGLLDGVQRFAVGQAFNRLNLAPMGGGNGRQTGGNKLTIEQHSARAALTFTAAVFRPGKMEIFAEHFEQATAIVCGDALEDAIDLELNGGLHRLSGSEPRKHEFCGVTPRRTATREGFKKKLRPQRDGKDAS